MHTLRRFGRPWQHGYSVVRELAVEADIRRRVKVLLHETVSSPVTYGVLRPTIVLPMDAPAWHEVDLTRAMIHELEHVRRCDWVSQCLARALCACYWFHPLVWIAWKQLALEAERACDDAVLRRAEATDYADQLVVLAQRMSTAPNGALLAVANRTHLAARIAAILDTRQQRGRAGRVRVALICVCSTLFIATLSPLRIAAAGQSESRTETFTGSLRDPLGRTLPDTGLTLWNAATHQPIATRTDRAGHFTFAGVPAGAYQLRVDEFGSQGQITFAPGLRLHRDIAVVMDGIDDTVTVYSSDVPTVSPPPPPPLPSPSNTSPPYQSQAELDRCAQVSMFCRVTPPVQTARVQPVYPTKQRASAVAGTVVVEGRVGTDGLVKDLHAVAPADPDFASATLDALRRWQFSPIRFDGVPVEMNIHVTANFVAQ